jgi:hypothetical protein
MRRFTIGKGVCPVICSLLFFASSAFSQARIKVAPEYEDTVRILLLWNDIPGSCNNFPPVGAQTRDFVVQSLDSSRVHHIKVMRNAYPWPALDQIRAAWGGDTLPHVLVHINAGWGGDNGPNLTDIFSWAVQNHVGVVSIGDDASWLADITFGFDGVNNVPPPLGDGGTIDSLWIGLNRGADEQIHYSFYPYVNGIVSNAVDSILHDSTMLFKGLTGRCQEDADQYNVRNAWKTIYLGYQQGYLNGSAQPVPNGLNVIVAIQDSIRTATEIIVRRGVALSFQPQFLRNATASQQIVYDAIMYASLAHTLRPARELRLRITAGSLTAGGIDTIFAQVYTASGQLDTALARLVVWTLFPDSSKPGDSYIDDANRLVQTDTASIIRFTATYAYRSARLIGTFTDPIFGTTRTAYVDVYIYPGPPSRLVIEGNPRSMAQGNFPVGGGTGSITLSATQTITEGAYAILRDQFWNYYGPSQHTLWDTLAGPTGALVVKAEVGTSPNLGQGRITKVNDNGRTYVRATSLDYGFKDTILAIVDPVTYNALRIVNANRNPIVGVYSMTTDLTARFILQGHRADEPNPAIFVDIPGDWSIAPDLNSGNAAPRSSIFWDFAPQDTGTAKVTAAVGTGSAFIWVHVAPGAPDRLIFYRRPGQPDIAGNTRLPSDTVLSIDSTLSINVALFSKNLWLQDYQSNPISAGKIGWRLVESLQYSASISSLTGASAVFTPLRANTIVSVIAWYAKGALDTIRDTISIRIQPGAPDHIQIIQDTISRTPLDSLTFSTNDTLSRLYAIVLDRRGNFLYPAYNTSWISRDVSVVIAADGNGNVGEGLLQRVAETESYAAVVASYIAASGQPLRDTIGVYVSALTYSKIRIVIRPVMGNPIEIDTLRLRTDDDTTLWAQGYRLNGRWDYIPVQWSKTASLPVAGAPPLAQLWHFSPTAVGNGFIKITGTGVSLGALPDSISVIFLPGSPYSIGIYPNTTATQPYSGSTAQHITAGRGTDLYARIFDHDAIRLTQYENDDSSRNVISWRVAQLPENISIDTLLSKTTTYHSLLTSTRAGTTYRVTATFTKGGTVLTSTALFIIDPDTAAMLVIEQSWQNYDPHVAVRYSPITFGGRESVKYAYAILRDRYGNFTGFSTNTDWITRNAAIATGKEGALTDKGEGEIDRVGTLGETWMIARNKAKPFLFDSAKVQLTNVSYDALRIVVNDSIPIDSLVITAGNDTVLMVQGLRHHDSAWVLIPADAWTFVNNAGTQNLAQGVDRITFAPNDTADGRIAVSLAGATPDTLKVVVNVGPPTRIDIYKKDMPPAPGDPTNIPYPRMQTVHAGERLNLVAIAFFRDIWLDNYMTSLNLGGQFRWQLIDPDTAAILSTKSGYKTVLTPIKAYDTITVIAKLYSTAVNDTLRDTVSFAIIPGLPYRLVLEEDAQPALNRAEPIDTVRISDNSFTGRVYGILRDSLNNFVGYSNPTGWNRVASQPDIVRVTTGQADRGEGIITKDTTATQDVTRIYAVDQNTGFRDSTFVKLLKYHYLRLRIEAGNATTAAAITNDTLRIRTTDLASLIVKGQRSDCTNANNPSCWEQVSAKWEAMPVLEFETPPPDNSPTWSFSPADTGRGWIRVILPSDPQAAPDSMRVVFSPGPPSAINITITTPIQQRVAGDTITAVVRITNSDGLVPGPWCDTVYYQDILGWGDRDSVPVAIVDGHGDTLQTAPDSSGKVYECFSGGIDTVKFVLYYAPDEWITQKPDSMHQFIVTLDNIKGQTDRFYLYPGALDRLVLDPRISSRFDTLTLRYPLGEDWIDAKGYDRYGNYAGLISSDWDVTGSLHVPGNSIDQNSIHYSSSTVTSSEEGWIIARAGIDTSVIDSIYVRVIGPSAAMDSVITHDVNGNGYLDQVVIKFDKKVLLPPGYDSTDIVIGFWDALSGDSVYLHVKSMQTSGPRGDSTSYLVLNLYEDTTYYATRPADPVPQTNWKPSVALIPGVPGLTGSIDQSTRIVDGAGPVVWRVDKYVENVSTRTEDRVRITFSEPIQDESGSSFKPGNETSTPAQLLLAWAPVSPGSSILVPVPGLFAGIDTFTAVDQLHGEWVEFYMTNDSSLTGVHRVSLAVDTARQATASDITDRLGNYPVSGNVPVRVNIIGRILADAVVGPNPIGPTMLHWDLVHEKDLMAFNEPSQPMQWAMTQGGGVIYVDWTLPSDTASDPSQRLRISATLKVYDLVGNMVYHTKNDNDVIPQEWHRVWDRLAGTNRALAFYWDGMTDRKMKSAPGVYRAILVLKEWPSRRVSVYTPTIGISARGVGGPSR